MRKSIFDKVNEYASDPITEHNKIKQFYYYKCYYSTSIFEFLEQNFKKCKSLGSTYISLRECIRENTATIQQYNQDNYYLTEGAKIKILNEFLTFCEIIYCMINISKKTPIYNSRNFDKEIFEQFISIIEKSLKSMNYKIYIPDPNQEFVEVIKIDPEIEIVAAQSPPTIRKAILSYLGIRDNNINEKERILLELINLLEPKLKKFTNVSIIKKIREYVQLLRHPETKKEEKEYIWYYNDKSKCVDKIFSLCVFVQHYDISEDIIDDFSILKSQGNNNN